MLVAGLAGQFALHAVYGIETFLYALHFQPLLVLLVAYGTRTRLRPLLLAACLVLVPLMMEVNLSRLDEATSHLSQQPHVKKTLKRHERSTGTVK
jgi:hypothetical protein